VLSQLQSARCVARITRMSPVNTSKNKQFT